MTYTLTIGLEVHARIKTNTKMFCSCKNADLDGEPNTNICSICTAQPGALPFLNKAVIERACILGRAIGADIAPTCEFDRKSYFYPDNPSGYQITQFRTPIIIGGSIECMVEQEKKKFSLHHIHIETDAGKLIHTEDGSGVDLNRAGCPLFEIVTDPVFHSKEDVSCFLKELQKILRYLEVSDADMEKGMLRADVNISLSQNETLGNRIEIKNMNSFSEIEKAIDYEYKRQERILQDGGIIEQETRGWNQSEGKTFTMRTKENAADYRYMPEPDIPTLHITKEFIAENTANIELPVQRYERFRLEYLLPHDDAHILTEDKHLANFFENAAKLSKDAKKSANLILSELLKYLKEDHAKITEIKMSSEDIAEMVVMINNGMISGKIAKEIFPECYQTGKNPSEIVHEKGLTQNSNIEELEALVQGVLEEQSALVEQYLSGKTKLFGAFVGQVMKKSQGKANPELVNEILKRFLGE